MRPKTVVAPFGFTRPWLLQVFSSQGGYTPLAAAAATSDLTAEMTAAAIQLETA